MNNHLYISNQNSLLTCRKMIDRGGSIFWCCERKANIIRLPKKYTWVNPHVFNIW